MQNDDKAIPLPRLARVLAAQYGRSPTYKQLYAAAVDGRLPVIEQPGRWEVRRQDLQQVAELFGLTHPAAA